jgi:mono/diheme cytochrome c family protein
MSFVPKGGGSWVAPKSADAIKNPLKGDAIATAEGKKIYNQMCSICHGAKGKGDGIAGTSLSPSPSNFTSDKVQAQTDGAIFWKLTEGKAPMASYKTLLKEEQRWQLYMNILKSK